MRPRRPRWHCVRISLQRQRSDSVRRRRTRLRGVFVGHKSRINSLVLIDRHYLQANVLVPLTSNGTERHWITRAKSNTTFRSIRSLGKDDELVEFTVSSEARRKDPSLPTHFDARVIRYQRKGYPSQLLLTSLVDERRYPAAKIRALYHERWEIELGFGEIKTDMQLRRLGDHSSQQKPVCRRTGALGPAARVQPRPPRDRTRSGRARRATDTHQLPGCTARSRRAVARFPQPSSHPARFPRGCRRIRTGSGKLLAPAPRRPNRVFPRAVKIKLSNYARKRPTKSSSGKRAK